MDDEDMFTFPSFEAFDTEDRPPPPSIGDYPIGCEVELIDYAPAKAAQTEVFWEPFMEDFFAKARRLVRVVRHSGDYTFVTCDDDPEVQVGITLYRACLSEPKVRFKKYIPTSASPAAGLPQQRSPVSLADEDANILQLDNIAASGTNEDDDDPFMRPIAPTNDLLARAFAPLNDPDAPFNFRAVPPAAPPASQSPEGLTTRIPHPPQATRASATAASPDAPMQDAPQRQSSDSSLRSQQKFNHIINRGLRALEQGRCEESVRWYTKALSCRPDQTARVLANRSAAYLAGHNAEAALDDAKTVILIAPENYVGYVRAGNVLRHLKRYEEAKEFYKKALDIEPNSKDVQYISLSNTVSMVFSSKMENRRSVTITLDREMTGVKASARRAIRQNETVWMETPLATAPISSGYSKLLDRQHDSHVCLYCLRSLVREQTICDAVPGLSSRLLRSLYTESHVVPCAAQCGMMYCSETCRTKSWAEAHWLECSVQGKWGEALKKAHLRVDDLHDRGEEKAASQIRIAFRMLSRLVSSGRSLNEAVNMYTWLKTGDSAGQPIAPAVEQCIVQIFADFSTVFNVDEREVLTYDFFMRCFQQAQYNSVKIRVSPWKSILSRTESHLALLSMREERNEALQRLAETNPRSIPWLVVDCEALLEVYSVALSAKASTDSPSQGNLYVKRDVETTINIPIIATRNIDRGTLLVGKYSA